MAVTSTAATTASVINSGAEGSVLSLNYGANSVADGDVLDVVADIEIGNHSGTMMMVTLKAYFGAASYTFSRTMNFPDDATATHRIARFTLMRSGVNLYLSIEGVKDAIRQITTYESNYPFVHEQVAWTPNFTIGNLFKLTATLSVVDPTAYVKSNGCKILQY